VSRAVRRKRETLQQATPKDSVEVPCGSWSGEANRVTPDMSKKRSGSSRSRKDQGERSDAIVIGVQLAAAAQAEQRRLAKALPAKSPMPKEKYDFECEEMSLLKPVPHPLDSRLASLCKRYAKSNDQERAAIRAAISMEEFYTLLTFAHRAAVFAIREHSAAWAVDGLTAVTMIEAERVDWRDILVALGLLHHAATRAGLDADQVFRDMSMLAEPGTAELVQDFRSRPRSDKKLNSWGFEEVETDEGIGLIQGGFGRTKPTYDLIAIAVEIADYLATDKYRPSSIDFGEMMPRVWLESRDNTALDKALKAFRTGASISAELRRTKGVKSGSQHFVVFLLEMRTEAAARQLLEIARKKKPTSFCKVELAAGRLFCLVVARSFWGGVKSYETRQSLVRFANPIGDILRRHV
jgi:hypothetical protein